MIERDLWVKPFVYVGAVTAALMLLFIAALAWYGAWLDERDARQWAISNGYCNIAVVPVQGDIVAYDGDSIYGEDETSAPVSTSGDWAQRYIENASYDPMVRGVVVEIDSWGGYAAPGHQIMNALARSPLPSAAYIREVGTSAGYLAALGADVIVASPFSSVGSIGITYSYVQNVEKNRQEGLEFIQLSSGEFKDTGNPNKPLTEAEKALYERDIAIFRDVFVDIVAASRGLSRETVAALADGSSMPGALAKENGLVDIVGDDEAVRVWFAQELGLEEEDIVFCK